MLGDVRDLVMNQILHFLGMQLPDPPLIAPSFHQPSRSHNLDETISETSAPVVQPEIRPYSLSQFQLSAPSSTPGITAVLDQYTARTDSLLESVDLGVLQTKKRRKKKPAVSVIPADAEYLQPWLSNLGMTEYESKQQRLAFTL